MNTNLWLITAKTNLHVGNENASNYGIIDKAVQRDVLTDLPCINSSSLKGAVNEYCAHNTEVDLLKVFGSDKNNKSKGSQKGSAIFYDAKLLYLPVQDEANLFHYATSDAVIAQLKDRLSVFDLSVDEARLSKVLVPGHNATSDDVIAQLKGLSVFGLSVDEARLSEVLVSGHKVEVMSAAAFGEMCKDENLPVIARNVLENGRSANLWYEQVIPAETVFFAVIQEKGEELSNALDGKIVQIGANATIGYGYCRFTKIGLKR